MCSLNQIVLFNVFLSDFVEITSCVYTKTIILFNIDEWWLWEYLPRFQRIIVNYPLMDNVHVNCMHSISFYIYLFLSCQLTMTLQKLWE